ncbi:hypothetical protein RRF57_003606 [Xylaria bambusicola]|uniref:Uncharacterized protein n=1 Tax=Xylaria bambusicola TaxID=326684 RepID=A0AAN7Z7S2_9PEZI
MLAAIGQENIEVIKLLLNANGFNPTRQYKGQTYYEIARRREGPNWKEEEHILKEAYDQFKKGSKSSSKSKSSPNRREREFDQDSRRGNRAEPTADAPRLQKRRTSASPPRDSEPKKKLNTVKAAKSPREKRRSLSFGTQDENASPKRGPGRPKRDERGSNTASSDREISPVRTKNSGMPKLIEPDVAGSSDGETLKPRRKLISGRDLKGQREKQRRESLASNVSGIDRSESKLEESSEKSRLDREKHLSRTKALKREESTERLSTTDASGKRHRSSASPSRRGFGDKEDNNTSVKRRKLDSDIKERRYLEPRSPENRHTKREPSRDSIHRQRNSDNDRVSKPMKTSRDHREQEKSHNSDKSITVASEDPDVEMRDSIQVSEEEGEIHVNSEKEDAKKQRRKTPFEASVHDEVRRKDTEHELQERGKRKQEEEVKRKEQEAEKKRLEAEERARFEREELKRKEAAEKIRLEEEKKLKEEEERRRKELEERKLREEQERRQREEQELRQREEQERQKREEQQRQQQEEQERLQREEEKRIQREKEAAEEARRLREEEERREREREEAERIARELEMQRAEQERIRVSKLPPLLRWLDGCSNPKKKEIAELFVKAQGVRYDTINPSATGKAGGRDQWLLSTQVALLLGEKDLSLSHCKHLR